LRKYRKVKTKASVKNPRLDDHKTQISLLKPVAKLIEEQIKGIFFFRFSEVQFLRKVTPAINVSGASSLI
jgi:hypothetical protein